MATIVKTPLRIKRKQSIIRGALKAFCERGVNGATVDDICNKAECSHGLFYHYYNNKEEILTDIKLTYSNFNQQDIKEVAESNTYTLIKLKEVLTRFFSLIKESEDFCYGYYFFVAETIRNGGLENEELNLYNPVKPYLDAIEYLICEGVYLGEISNKFKKEDLIATINSILTGTVLNYIAQPKELKSAYKLPSVDLIIETIKNNPTSSILNISAHNKRLSV